MSHRTFRARVATPTTIKFVRWMKVHRRLSDSTVRAYGDAVEKFVGYQGIEPDTWEEPHEFSPHSRRGETTSDLDWSTVTVEQVETFAEIDNPSASGFRIRVAALRLLFGYLNGRGVCDHNPAKEVVAPRGSRRNPRPVTDAQWLKVWTSDLGIEDRLTLGFMYYAGLRRHEVALLGVEHVSPSDRTIQWFDRKGGKEGGVVYYGSIIDKMERKGLPCVTAETHDFIRLIGSQVNYRRRMEAVRLIAAFEGVSGSVDAHAVNRTVERVQHQAGIMDTFTPHQLRHSFATNCLRIGMPPIVMADQMSHADLSTTMRYVATDAWFDDEGAAA